MFVTYNMPLNPKTISRKIEEYRVTKGLSYIEAAVDYCTAQGIEQHNIPALITQSLKKKIEHEGLRNHTISKAKKVA